MYLFTFSRIRSRAAVRLHAVVSQTDMVLYPFGMASLFIGKFFQSFTVDWVAWMSGGASVALATWAAVWPTPLPSWAFWVAAGLCLVLASYRIWRKEYENCRKLQEKLDIVEQTKPLIKIKNVYVDRRLLLDPKTQVGTEVYFCHIVLVNEPDHFSQTATVENIQAQISYYDSQDKEIASVNGRWGDSPQPLDRSIFDSMRDLTFAKFEVGSSRELNVALKYPEDSACYGFCNESYRFSDWKDESLILPGAEHKVEVTIRGPWINQRHTLLLKNPGKGKRPELKLMEYTL